MRKHRCINCARYQPEDIERNDAWCSILLQLDNCDEMEDPETSWCGEWVALKHLPAMAIRSGIRDLKNMLENKRYQPYLTDAVRDRVGEIIKMLERGLRK